MTVYNISLLDDVRRNGTLQFTGVHTIGIYCHENIPGFLENVFTCLWLSKSWQEEEKKDFIKITFLPFVIHWLGLYRIFLGKCKVKGF